MKKVDRRKIEIPSVCIISMWKYPCLQTKCQYHLRNTKLINSETYKNAINYPQNKTCPFGKKWAGSEDEITKAKPMQRTEEIKETKAATTKEEDWKNEPITHKQKVLIQNLELDYKEFKGTTKGEASEYITEAIAYYRKRDEEEGWVQEATHENAGDRI